MKSTLLMKTLAFTFMCTIYIFSLSQVSASPLNGSAVNTASSKQHSLLAIQSQWLLALESNEGQEKRFYELQAVARKMFKLSIKHPKDVQLKAWSGVMLGSFSGASIKGRGEHVAIFAKRMLESAQDKQLDILDTSYLVNGMSARNALQNALAYNPSGVDINQYYGAFLPESQGKMLAINKGFNTDKSTQEVTHAIN